MKKRLLVLALCLVLVSSLLPITAAAEGPIQRVYVCGNGEDDNTRHWVNGVDWNDNPEPNIMKVVSPDVYEITYNDVGQNSDLQFLFKGLEKNDDIHAWGHHFGGSFVGSGVVTNAVHYTHNGYQNIKFSVPYALANITLRLDLSNFNYETKEGATFTVTITEAHDWQFTVSENHDTLTAQCQNQQCRKEVSVTLKADSVTLPNNPFNARLEGKQEFGDATGAEIGEIVYKCNKEIVTDQSNPKAGQYQAWVMIKNLPGPVYQDGVAALAEDTNTKSTAELFVHYTAADPAITAQTGDDRPIELMLVCALAFSALAAAAFALDSKRRSQQ